MRDEVEHRDGNTKLVEFPSYTNPLYSLVELFPKFKIKLQIKAVITPRLFIFRTHGRLTMLLVALQHQ